MVIPAWYQSPLFKTAVLILLVCFIYFLFWQRTFRLKQRQVRLQYLVEEQTIALDQANKSLLTISDIGKEITTTLDLDLLLEKIFSYTSQLMATDIFGIGIYRKNKDTIEFELAIENGKRFEPYTRDMNDKNQLAVWCIEHNQEIFIKDSTTEITRYIKDVSQQEKGFELKGGMKSSQPLSYMYIPLSLKGNVIGVITVQSYKSHAFNESHLSMLKTLASYAAIAIDNADKHQQINSANQALLTTQKELQQSYKLMQKISVTDQLTGLKNRHFLVGHINKDIDKST